MTKQTPNVHRHGGFTLIELLVVIGIIAVLIGFAFPAYQGVIDRAKKVQAKNDVTQIVTAVNAFYTEYGRYPTTATADVYFGPLATAPAGTTKLGENDLLLDVLRNNTGNSANTTTVASLNPRGINFLELRMVKDNAKPISGVTSNTATNPGRFYDPWGSGYSVAIDSSYDNSLPNPYADQPGGAPLMTGVLVWSFGKNNAFGGGGTEKGSAGNYTNSGDVISWQ